MAAKNPSVISQLLIQHHVQFVLNAGIRFELTSECGRHSGGTGLFDSSG